MEGATLALLLLVPATAVFAYAGWKEYRRYRAEGPSSYGLTYDPETNTTHVGPLPEGEESFDPEEFEPAAETGETDEAEEKPLPDDRDDPQPEDDPAQEPSR
jgi:hypothetical protein